MINIEKNKTIKEHFVPQFYLKNFYHENEAFWVYDKYANKIFESNSYGVCFENYLYETKGSGKLSDGKHILPNLIEKKLADVDAKNSIFINNIIKRLSIQISPNALILKSSEVEQLLDFIDNLFIRHPDCMNSFLTEENYKKVLSNNPDVVDNIDELFEILGFGDSEAFKKVSVKNMYFDSNGKGVSYKKYFKLMDYFFLKASEGVLFTADYPIRMDLNYDNQTFNSIYLPISNEYAIVLVSQRSFNRNRLITIDKATIDKLNKYVLFDSFNKKIITSNKEQIESILKSVKVQYTVLEKPKGN